MISIDSSWSSWVIALSVTLNAILAVLYLFKAQIGAMLPKSVSSLFRLKADQQDHEQEIEESLVDHELQAKATEQLREARREDRAWHTIASKDSYLHGYLNSKVDELKQSQDATRLEVVGLRNDLNSGLGSLQTAIGQTNNLLKELTIALTRRG